MNKLKPTKLLVLLLAVGSLFYAVPVEAEHPWGSERPAKGAPVTDSSDHFKGNPAWEEQLLVAAGLLPVPPKNKYAEPNRIVGDPWEDEHGPDNRPGKPN